MLAVWLGVAGVLLAAGAAGAEVRALRREGGAPEREAQLADLAEEFASTAEAVLKTVEARTGALEALIRQVLAAQAAPAPAPPAAERPVRAVKAQKRPHPAPATSPLVHQVAELAGQGCPVPEIARRLGLSRGAVEVALRLSEQAAEEVQ